MGVVKDEMLEIRRRFADPRRTEITKIVEDIDMDDIIQEEDMVVTCTHHGYIKRIAEATYRTQRRGGVGISAEQPVKRISLRIFSSQARIPISCSSQTRAALSALNAIPFRRQAAPQRARP